MKVCQAFLHNDNDSVIISLTKEYIGRKVFFKIIGLIETLIA